MLNANGVVTEWSPNGHRDDRLEPQGIAASRVRGFAASRPHGFAYSRLRVFTASRDRRCK